MSSWILDRKLEAQRKGFEVVEDRDGWWILTPLLWHRPQQRLGAYKSADRAWMAAALTSRDYPDA